MRKSPLIRIGRAVGSEFAAVAEIGTGEALHTLRAALGSEPDVTPVCAPVELIRFWP